MSSTDAKKIYFVSHGEVFCAAVGFMECRELYGREIEFRNTN